MFKRALAKSFFLILLTLLSTWLFSFSSTVYAMLPVIDVAALAQLGNQLAELKLQTQSIQQALQTLSGDQYQWSQTQGLLNQLGSILQKTQEIAANAAKLDEVFKEHYPGYQSPRNFAEQYQKNIHTAQQTMNGVLQSLGLSAQHFQEENTRLAFLQQQVQTAQGQTQAIQASSQISSELVSQLQLLRQTLIAQTNAQTAYYATHLQTEASHRAELEALFKSTSTEIPAYGTSGESVELPDFQG